MQPVNLNGAPGGGGGGGGATHVVGFGIKAQECGKASKTFYSVLQYETRQLRLC